MTLGLATTDRVTVVVRNEVDRDRLFPEPALNQTVFRLDTNTTEKYDGTDWATVTGAQDFAPEEFGAKGDGVTDDAAAILAAITAASAERGTVNFTPGKTYLLGTKLTVTDKHVNIRLNGAKIVRAADLGEDEGIVLDTSFGAIVNVVSLANTATLIGEGETPTNVARIELASVAGWAIGDVLKIFCSDLIPYGSRDDEGDPRNEVFGEIVKVAKVEAPYLYTAKPLRIAPVNDIRISKLTRYDCRIENGVLSDPDDAEPRHNHPFMKVTGAVEPVFTDLNFDFIMGAALQLESCFQPRTYNPRFGYCHADLALFTYGYGIHEFACTDGRHYGIDAGDVRHAYTTGAHEVTDPETETDVSRYGGVVGTIVYNGAVLASGNSGFDTHEDATDVWFIGCTVTQEYQGNAAAGFCFKLRGKDNGMIGCKSTGAGALDLNAVGEGGGNYVVKSHVHMRPVGYSRTTEIVRIRSEWATTPARMTVELDVVADRVPGNIVTVDNTEVALTLNGDVAFNTFDDDDANGEFSRCGWVSLTNEAVVTMADGFLRMDRSNQAFVTGATQQTPYLVQINDATACVFRSDRLRLRAGAATQYHLAQGGDGAAVAVGTVLFGDLKTDTTPGAAATYGFYNFAGGTLRALVYIADSLIAWLSSVAITSDQTALDVTNLKTVTVNSSGGDVNLYGLAGGVAGQVIDIIKTSSSNRIILQHNDGTGTQKIFCPMAADIILTGYSGIRLLFSGTNWYAVGGRIETAWSSKTGDYTVANADDGLFLGGSTPRTLTLQAAAGRTRPLMLRVTGSATWAITRAGSDTVEGGTSINLLAGESIMLMPNGTNWLIVA